MSNVEFLFKQRSNILYGHGETEYLYAGLGFLLIGPFQQYI